jgi:hypothetical protein
MARPDKLVIVNDAELRTKYGAGFADIEAALADLIAADAARDLVTQVLAIDKAADMRQVGGRPVGGPADERGAKAAVDAAFKTLTPDYILLLDGPDVVPHIRLSAIAGLNDDDLDIPSDLPYACGGGWSRDAARYLNITRVVGRLPASPGTSDPGELVALINHAVQHVPLPIAAFAEPFAISASVWMSSTQTSVNTTFGPGFAVDAAPPATHPGIDRELGRRSHFINCHGAQASDEFYGQAGDAYPMAMKSDRVTGRVSGGAIVAAECCYGAELYDHVALGAPKPICMTYLEGGAAAYVGSTNIAYGPAAGNGQADLVTQNFLKYCLEGASAGRALLQARQEFVRTQVMSQADNLKTIAQFLLLGDPSCHPCAVATPPRTGPGDAEGAAAAFQAASDPNAARKARRLALGGEGRAAASSATRAAGRGKIPEEVAQRLRDLAEARGMPGHTLQVFDVTGGPAYKAASKVLGETRKIAVVADKQRREGLKTPRFRVMFAQIVGGRIVRVSESESR